MPGLLFMDVINVMDMETREPMDNQTPGDAGGGNKAKLDFFSSLLKLLKDEVLYKGLLYSMEKQNYEMVALYRNELQQRGRMVNMHNKSKGSDINKGN